ncbi:MAG: type II secretion system protein [Dehalococcoidia bacterium]|nr:MAG: type II secretion system protein [Dehalococcoidia bacterium]
MKKVKKDERGFSFLEIGVALLIITILVAVVILIMTGFFSKARETGLEADLRNVKTAVDSYATESMQWPTANGKLPYTGEYAPIDFYASFSRGGKTMSFYPHFLQDLPKHADEGVWLIDSASRLSLDMDPEEY